MLDVTVVTPTIPPRTDRLAKALGSVWRQTCPPVAVAVTVDRDHDGAGKTRDRALAMVETEWVAFLDDDDWLYPHHLQTLCNFQQAVEHSGAQCDVVYPWFDVGGGGTDPFPQFEGQKWDRDQPHLFPITALCRTQVARDAGGFFRPPVHTGEPWDTDGWSGEDWPFWQAVNAIASIWHVPERTWCWEHWTDGGRIGNTSGRGDRW